VFDRHDELSVALDHLPDIAATMSVAELPTRRFDSDVKHLGSV